MQIKVNEHDFSINFNLKPRNQEKFFNNEYKIYFFGFFRIPIESIKKIIENFKIKKFTNENIEKIFKKINGVCTILISSDSEIKICTSIYHPFLKLFKTEEGFIITNNEFREAKKISSTKSFLKLFSHHSFFIHEGLSEDVIDFIPPGGIITFKKNEFSNYNFSWYLNFENFCSRDDHEKIVDDLTESYLGVFDNLDNKKEYFFALSGGLDSAVALGAAVKKGLNIKPFHITRGMYSDELKVAEGVSNYFGRDLLKVYKYGKKFTSLGYSDDITESLEYNYNYIKKDSIFFLSHNFIVKKNFHNSHVFTGTGDPLLLTINHFMVYSDRIKKNFGYDLHSDKRYFYSKNFFEHLKNQTNFNLKDEDVFLKEFANIDVKYIPLFQSFVDQLTKQYDFRSKFFAGNTNIRSKDASPIKDITYNQAKLLKDIKLKKSISLIKKILKSKFFYEKLKVFDARTAQILLKFFHFLGQYGKENHQTSMMHDEINTVEYVAMNSSIALNHLSVIIDERLVNFSKWHCFKVFEKINGCTYEKIYQRPSLKDPKFVFQRLHSKIKSKLSKIPEGDDNYMFINNNSLKKFIKKKKIIEKYNDFKSSHDFKELLYEFPSEDEIKNYNNTVMNLWKINNIINIVNKFE